MKRDFSIKKDGPNLIATISDLFIDTRETFKFRNWTGIHSRLNSIFPEIASNSDNTWYQRFRNSDYYIRCGGAEFYADNAQLRERIRDRCKEEIIKKDDFGNKVGVVNFSRKLQGVAHMSEYDMKKIIDYLDSPMGPKLLWQSEISKESGGSSCPSKTKNEISRPTDHEGYIYDILIRLFSKRAHENREITPYEVKIISVMFQGSDIFDFFGETK